MGKKIRQLENYLQQAKDRIDYWANKVVEEENRANAFRALVDGTNLKNERLLADKAKLMDENRKLKEDMEKVIYSSEVGYKNQIISLQADLEYWKKEYENLSQNNYKTLEVNKQLMEQVILWRSKYEEETRKLKIEIADLWYQNNVLHKEKTTFESQNNGLNSENKDLCDAYNKVLNETRQLTFANDVYKRTTGSLQNSRIRLLKLNMRMLEHNRLLKKKWFSDKATIRMWFAAFKVLGINNQSEIQDFKTKYETLVSKYKELKEKEIARWDV